MAGEVGQQIQTVREQFQQTQQAIKSQLIPQPTEVQLRLGAGGIAGMVARQQAAQVRQQQQQAITGLEIQKTAFEKKLTSKFQDLLCRKLSRKKLEE